MKLSDFCEYRKETATIYEETLNRFAENINHHNNDGSLINDIQLWEDPDHPTFNYEGRNILIPGNYYEIRNSFYKNTVVDVIKYYNFDNTTSGDGIYNFYRNRRVDTAINETEQIITSLSADTFGDKSISANWVIDLNDPYWKASIAGGATEITVSKQVQEYNPYSHQYEYVYRGCLKTDLRRPCS